jgi:cell division protein FtsZ
MNKRSWQIPISIKVVGIGGAGCNALNRMIREHITGAEFIAVNTDTQHLATVETPIKVVLGEKVTHGGGAGGDPAVAKKCAECSLDEIREALKGADMVFLAAGMGGGTGTGATPIIADIAREMNILTAAIVTHPFGFEGKVRSQVAKEGTAILKSKVDTLIVVSNDRAMETFDHTISIHEAFLSVDQILCQAVKTIIELVTVPGLVNIDFASVRNVLKGSGPALISIGQATGQNRAIQAAKNALSNSLLDIPIASARKVIFRISGGGNLTAMQVNDAANLIKKAVHPQADIVFGVLLDPNLVDETRMILIATDFEVKDTFEKSLFDQRKTTFIKS